ncbi:hypothetical protein [Bdellovibrio sp. HCB274]|uniref:hypothetical protein n=1 Tax=Bdellovibrio sp. HCB274 TaxID=3394361 RepID=UPI0039B58D84
MSDAALKFRKQTSEMLRAAMAARETEAVSAIRAVLAAVDNASAIPKDEIARLDPAVTEVPRRVVTGQMIAEILKHEIESRRLAQAEYERLGNLAQAEKYRVSLETLEQLLKLLA